MSLCQLITTDAAKPLFKGLYDIWCRRRDLNPHEHSSPPPQDGVSTNSTTSANIYQSKLGKSSPLDPVTAGEAVSRTGSSASTAAGFTSTAAGIAKSRSSTRAAF